MLPKFMVLQDSSVLECVRRLAVLRGKGWSTGGSGVECGRGVDCKHRGRGGLTGKVTGPGPEVCAPLREKRAPGSHMARARPWGGSSPAAGGTGKPAWPSGATEGVRSH